MSSSTSPPSRSPSPTQSKAPSYPRASSADSCTGFMPALPGRRRSSRPLLKRRYFVAHILCALNVVFLASAANTFKKNTPPFLRITTDAEAYLADGKPNAQTPAKHNDTEARTKEEVVDELTRKRYAETHVTSVEDLKCPDVLPRRCYGAPTCRAAGPHTKNNRPATEQERRQCINTCETYMRNCDWMRNKKDGIFDFRLQGASFCGVLSKAPPRVQARCETVPPPHQCAKEKLEELVSPYLLLWRHEDDNKIDVNGPAAHRSLGLHVSAPACRELVSPGDKPDDDPPPLIQQPPAPPDPPLTPPPSPPHVHDAYSRYSKDRPWDAFQTRRRSILDIEHAKSTGYCTPQCAEAVQTVVWQLMLCGTHEPEKTGYAVGMLRARYGPSTCRGAYRVLWPRGARGERGDAEAAIAGARHYANSHHLRLQLGKSHGHGTPEQRRRAEAMERIINAQRRMDEVSIRREHMLTDLDPVRGTAVVERMGNASLEKAMEVHRQAHLKAMEAERRKTSWIAEHAYAQKLAAWAKGFARGLQDATRSAVENARSKSVVFVDTGRHDSAMKDELFKMPLDYFAANSG
ncbi:hypothetical protein PPROV_000577700 [Pycnococcus provasolii]|uniref:Uncharacterized protein n=1 Tax=Pycnococcus provasolii TaxID=41880 RepID=A0A830HIS9_9CHLO|nr:hypothetical protein PPROV_000577700 [Pycnococcus provasolii]